MRAQPTARPDDALGTPNTSTGSRTVKSVRRTSDQHNLIFQ